MSAILRDTPPPITDLEPSARDLARIDPALPGEGPERADPDRARRRQSSCATSLDLPRPATPIGTHPLGSGDVGRGTPDEGFWVAVLPFKHTRSATPTSGVGGGSLRRDRDRSVAVLLPARRRAQLDARATPTSAADVRAVSQELGARYVMEGSLRQAGVAAPHRGAAGRHGTGAHLWAETYERTFSPEADLRAAGRPRSPHRLHRRGHARRPASQHERSAPEPGRADELSPYEALLRSFGYYERGHPEGPRGGAGRSGTGRRQAPGHADCWALLSMMYADEHGHGFNLEPDSLGRALQAARRAVEAAPSSALAYYALAQALFFRREFQAFRNAAERAVALNPMDGGTTAFMGVLMAYAGDWEHGCALAERAVQLNPHHPGWYRFGS